MVDPVDLAKMTKRTEKVDLAETVLGLAQLEKMRTPTGRERTQRMPESLEDPVKEPKRLVKKKRLGCPENRELPETA